MDFAASMEAGAAHPEPGPRHLGAAGCHHRDQEVFPEFVYTTDAVGVSHVHGQEPAASAP